MKQARKTVSLFLFNVLKTLFPSQVEGLDLAQMVELKKIRLEASSKCQLKCPMCPTAKGTNREGVVGWGNLRFENFKKLIESNPSIDMIELSNWGEIFLNPELKDILKLAHEEGVALTISNGANFNHATDETIAALVKYGVQEMTVSLDGASPETYQTYRVGGNFDTVIENIRKLNQYKNAYHSQTPRLRWQFVVFGHNEKELPLARQMAKDLNMEFCPKLCVDHWDVPFSPVRDVEFVRREMGSGAATREEFRQQNDREYMVPCWQFWTSPQVNWDGKILGCCDNIWGDYGNAFESGLEPVVNSERYVYTKKMLMGQVESRADIPCSNCTVYKRRALPRAIGGLSKKRRLISKLFLNLNT